MAGAMEEYKAFVRAHPAQVKRMEEMGRVVAMLLPASRFGRFSDVFQESTYSVLGLVSLYHDRILKSASEGAAAARLTPALLVRYALTLFAHTEVVLEMLARLLGGERRHLQLVYLIECFKAAGRLLLLARTKAGEVLRSGGQLQGRPRAPAALGGVEPEEPAEPSADSATDDARFPGQGRALGDTDAKDRDTASRPPQWRGKRSGKVLTLPESMRSLENVATESAGDGAPATEAHPLPDQADQQLATREHGELDAMGPGPEDVVLRATGEVLHILRPVVYLFYQQRVLASKGGARSWSPFLLSLTLEGLSLRCSSAAMPVEEGVTEHKVFTSEEIATRAFNKLLRGGAATQSKATEDELRRRRGLLALYFMRSPVFDKLTLPAVQRVASSFSGLPGIGGSIESMATDAVMYYHRNHFYCSGS